MTTTKPYYDRFAPYHICLITAAGHLCEDCYKSMTEYRVTLLDYQAAGWQIIDTMRGFKPDWAVTVMFRVVIPKDTVVKLGIKNMAGNK